MFRQFQKLEAAQAQRLDVASGHESKYSYDIAQSRSSVAKNRYRDVVPFDYNRVRPGGASPLYYINASYVEHRGHKWIASQGPLKNTIVDFWEMGVRQPSSTIVMLCSTEENGRPKCAEYWPSEVGAALDFADPSTSRQVKVINEQEAFDEDAQATVRTLDVTLRTPAGVLEKTIRHIHFKSWPDHDIAAIKNILSLIQLSGNLHSEHRSKNEEDLITVHCSAGCGRTGTFIALHALMQDPEQDIVALVDSLRQQRILSVQTLSQFELLNRYVESRVGKADLEK